MKSLHPDTTVWVASSTMKQVQSIKKHVILCGPVNSSPFKNNKAISTFHLHIHQWSFWWSWLGRLSTCSKINVREMCENPLALQAKVFNPTGFLAKGFRSYFYKRCLVSLVLHHQHSLILIIFQSRFIFNCKVLKNYAFITEIIQRCIDYMCSVYTCACRLHVVESASSNTMELSSPS